MINSGLGPARNTLAKRMGLTAGQMKEGLSDGSILFEEFQDALIKLNGKGGGGLKSLEQIAKYTTPGTGPRLANMKTAIVRGVANVVTKIDEGLKSAGFKSISEIIADKGAKMEAALSKFVEMIPPMIKTVKELYDTLEPFAPVLAGFSERSGTMMTINKVNSLVEDAVKGYKNWRAATEGVTTAQKVLSNVMKANWIGIIVSAMIFLIV
ncbi:tape measure protein [Enterococcus faecalis]|uniref:tape measure protein n=1 Tax=Enterococcus faecalis TaxID=1351 RepID=UPI003DA14935